MCVCVCWCVCVGVCVCVCACVCVCLRVCVCIQCNVCLLRGNCEVLQGRLDFNPPLCILFINSVGMVSSLMSVAYAWCVRNVETKLATAARDRWVVLPLIQPLHFLAFDYWVTPSSFHNTLSSLAVANVGGSCKCACDKKDLRVRIPAGAAGEFSSPESV